jgi:PAS domain S-box-containing protein
MEKNFDTLVQYISGLQLHNKITAETIDKVMTRLSRQGTFESEFCLERSGQARSNWYTIKGFAYHSHRFGNIFMFVIHDITDKKRVLAQALAARKQYYSLSKTVKEALMIFDTEGNLVDCNQKVLKKSGYTREQFISLKLWDVFTKESYISLKRCMAELPQKKRAICCKAAFLTKAKVKIPVKLRLASVNAGGKTKILCIGSELRTENAHINTTLAKFKQKLIKQKHLLKNKETALLELIELFNQEETRVRAHIRDNINGLLIPLIAKLK